MSRRTWRHVHFEDGEVWDYQIHGGRVLLRDPGGVKHHAWGDDIKGLPVGSVERGRWKGTSDGMILPSEVKAYVAGKRREARGVGA